MTHPLRIRELPTWLLSQAALRSHRILQERLGARGARGHHVRVLAALDEHGPLPQVDLGAHAALDRGDLSVALDELAEDGCISREPDDRDRRRKVVSLTPHGEQRLAELAAVLDQVQQEVLGPLSAEEREALIVALRGLQPGATVQPAVTGIRIEVGDEPADR